MGWWVSELVGFVGSFLPSLAHSKIPFLFPSFIRSMLHLLSIDLFICPPVRLPVLQCVFMKDLICTYTCLFACVYFFVVLSLFMTHIKFLFVYVSFSLIICLGCHC